MNVSKGNYYFCNNATRTCSYGFKILRKIEIKNLLHFRVYLYVLDTFNTSCLSIFNKVLKQKYELLEDE